MGGQGAFMALKIQWNVKGFMLVEGMESHHSSLDILCLLADAENPEFFDFQERDFKAPFSGVEKRSPELEALFHSASSIVTMAKPRERQPCRRGSGCGSSSRPPAADAHHHCCCCYCYRRAGTPHLQASQFLDTRNPAEGPLELPAFGTAVFNLGHLSAHISVLFVRNSEEDGEGSNDRETPSDDQSRRAEDNTKGVPEKAPAQPQTQEASTSKAREERAGLPKEYGWVPIIEEEPEEELEE